MSEANPPSSSWSSASEKGFGRGRGRGLGRGRGFGRGRGRGRRDAGGGGGGGGRGGRASSPSVDTTKEPSSTNVPRPPSSTGGTGRGRGRGRVGAGGGKGRSSSSAGRGKEDPKNTHDKEVAKTVVSDPEDAMEATDGRGKVGRGDGGGCGGGGRGKGGRSRGRVGGRGNGKQQNDDDPVVAVVASSPLVTSDSKSESGKIKKKNKNQNQNQKKNDQPKADDQLPKKDADAGDTNPKPNNEGNKSQKNKPKQTQKNKNKDKGFIAKAASTIPPNQSQQTSDINYGRGQKITIFHVAEKPSIAQAIAHGLASKPSDIDKKTKSLPVFEFTTSSNNKAFPKAPHASSVLHKVSSVAGHVFEVDFPTQFQSWDSVDPLELFQAPIIRKPSKGSVVKHLQDQAKNCDFIVLWMDCDREGENINFEVLDCCMHLMKTSNNTGNGTNNYDRVYRAYFSAITPADIQKAYGQLGKPDQNQAWSVDARQELDLKVGVAFSRFQTRFFQGRYGDLDSSVVSYGPCQTPTLGFCVQRHIDIETFKPEPYWVLELGVLKRGRMLRATWESGRSFNKNKTESLIEKTFAKVTHPTAVVTNVVIKEKKQGRPTPLNTVALLKACSKALGIGPHAAMQAAERLYLSGYLSYPRTESTAYPKSFDIPGTLQQQAGDSRWGAYVRELLSQGPTKSRGGVDMGDHPPITPCRSAGPHELSGDMGRIFEFVVRHFIASVSPDAVWQSTKIDFEVEALSPKGKFFLSGKELVTPGFLAILLHKEYSDKQENDEEDEEERAIPEFTKGEVIPVLKSNVSASGGGGGGGAGKVNVATATPVWASLDIKEKKTTAPGYLTESELIGMMEKHGIGTDASISTHIQNIQNRNYVRLETGRRLVPNKLGMVLVQGYHQIDSSLVLPKVRSDIEGQCNQIAKGIAEKDAVVRKAIAIFEEKFAYFVKNIGRMDVLFSTSFSKLEDVGKAFTRCGHTRRYLQFIPGPPPRLYNRHTESVYPLPVGGEVKQWSGRLCPVPGCYFELCLYSVGAPPRTFPLCPNCFNSPDWRLELDDEEDNDGGKDKKKNVKDAVDKEDEHKERQIKKMAGRSLTLECPLPDDHPLIDDLYVSPDPDSDGIFILDPHFGPKWRLVATREATIIHLPKSIDKLTVLDEKEEVLGCHKIKVEFKEGQSPLPDGATKHTCFYPTDELLQTSSRVFHGSERTASKGRGGRGRGGRGRGRGGGRGRGRN